MSLIPFKFGVNLNLNVNVNANQVAKWANLRVARRFEKQPDEVRRRKLFTMAQECATMLRLNDWDVVIWPPISVTHDVLDILSSSKECIDPSKRSELAWEISGADHKGNPADMYVTDYLGINNPNQFLEIEGSENPFRICKMLLTHVIEKSNIEYLRDELMMEILSEEDKISNITCPYPLFHFLGALKPHVAVKDKSSIKDYQKAWVIHFDSLKNSLHQFNQSEESVFRRAENQKSVPGLLDFMPPDSSLKCICEVQDILSTTSLAAKKGFNIAVSTDDKHFRWKDDDAYPQFIENAGLQDIYRQFRFVGLQVSHKYLSSVLLKEYVVYLDERLRGRRNIINRATNLLRLREKHFFGAHSSSNATSVWEDFQASLTSRIIGGGKPSEPDVANAQLNAIEAMWKVLGGQEHNCPNIQSSLVSDILEMRQTERNSFRMRLSRRHVRLIRCGQDCALVIPYANKIILKLNDDKWVQAMDIKAKQPLLGAYNEGAVRRAANILLALDFEEEGNNVLPVVNTQAYEKLKEYAEKGELYSDELRKVILPTMVMRRRVSVWTLTVVAEKVFSNKMMVASLVRELIHDRLVIGNSEFGACRVNDENDAYYHAVYLDHCFVRNNIDWGMGVPVHGIGIIKTKEGSARGIGRVIGGTVRRRDSARDTHDFWIAADKSPTEDFPTVFISLCKDNNNYFQRRSRKSKHESVQENRDTVPTLYFGEYKVGQFVNRRKIKITETEISTNQSDS